MLVDSTSTSTAAGVTGAIRQAAGTTGASFQYLLATAQLESGLNPTRKASTSSATGLFQFIDQTWLGTLKDTGASLGYGNYADAITRTKSGRLIVRDPAMRTEIMNLRKDPTANALMAGAFTRQNAAWLQTKIGRAPTDSELYMAHFLGAGGASKLIKAASQNPGTKAPDLFPRAARSNNSIFYDRQGNARTAAQVYGVLSHKLDAARAKNPSSPQTADAAAVAQATIVAPVIAPPIVAPAPLAAPAAARMAEPAGVRSAADVPTMVRTTRILPPGAPAEDPLPPTSQPGAPADVTASPVLTDVAPVVAVSSATSRSPAVVPSPPAPASPSGQPANAYAAPAAVAPVSFYDLFRTDGRQGVSATVSELWGARAQTDAPAAVAPAASAGEAGTGSGPAPRAPLNLFPNGHPQRPRFDRSS